METTRGNQLECIHVDGNMLYPLTKAARKMFIIKYIPKPERGNQTDEVVVLARDLAEAISMTTLKPFYSKISQVKNVTDLGHAIDTDLLKYERRPVEVPGGEDHTVIKNNPPQSDRFSRIV